MNVDEVATDLLKAPLSEFTRRRNATARELKASKQGELAGQVLALKKPPVAVWAVNQLGRRDASRLERIGKAGQSVVQAQAGAVAGRKDAAPELRQASSALQRELEDGVKAATAILRTDGHSADEATLRRVQEILRLAAVTGGETWRRLGRGALITEPKAGEDMLTAAFAAGAGGGGAGAGTGATPRSGGAVAARPRGDARAKAAEATAARLARVQAQQTEKRVEMEHALRTAKMDAARAHEANETAKRLRRQSDEVVAEARRAAQRARQAERVAIQATARATASQRAARRFKGAE